MSKKKVVKYTTPPGKMEQEVDFPFSWSDEKIEAAQRRGIRCIDWNGFRMLVGGEYKLDFFNELAMKMRQNKSIIILISGSPGQGKTYCALRLGEILDKKFDVRINVAFDRGEILHLIGPDTPLQRRQVILIDEAHFAASARSWYEDVQKDLMNSMAAIRSKGFVIIIVALHLNMLDKILRQYVLSYMIHMEKQGEGIIYRLHTPRFESNLYRNRLGKISLELPGFENCAHPNCLECRYRDKCFVSRAIYERRKKNFIDTKAELSERKQEEKRKAESFPSDNEFIELVYQHKDLLRYTNRGTIDYTSIQDIADLLGYSIGRSKSQGIAQRTQRKYPELKLAKEGTQGG